MGEVTASPPHWRTTFRPEDSASSDGWFVHVFVDAASREPVTIPESIRSALERLILPEEEEG